LPDTLKIKRLQLLLAAATVLTGLLAGETVDRLIVGFPAWQQVDILTWAEYSRNADLGNGVFVYPIEGIGSFLLLMTASVLLFRTKIIDRSYVVPVHLASVFAASALILTFFAAPFMLSIKNISDPASLQYAFNRFFYWSTFRGISLVLSFLCCIWAMHSAFTSKFNRRVT
jgi:hypothetical protein